MKTNNYIKSLAYNTFNVALPLKKPSNENPFERYKFVANAEVEIRNALTKYSKNHEDSSISIADIGGGDGSKIREVLGEDFGNSQIYNFDIEDYGESNTIIQDLCEVVSDPALVRKFDIIYSFNVFEHFREPHIAADNVCSMLKENGLLCVHTVFSWRYHPVPKDYFRFSDDGLEYLFSVRNKMKKIMCGFDISRRREDIKGGYFGDQDVPPIDSMGGWRENWGVFFIGTKQEQEQIHEG